MVKRIVITYRGDFADDVLEGGELSLVESSNCFVVMKKHDTFNTTQWRIPFDAVFAIEIQHESEG